MVMSKGCGIRSPARPNTDALTPAHQGPHSAREHAAYPPASEGPSALGRGAKERRGGKEGKGGAASQGPSNLGKGRHPPPASIPTPARRTRTPRPTHARTPSTGTHPNAPAPPAPHHRPICNPTRRPHPARTLTRPRSTRAHPARTPHTARLPPPARTQTRPPAALLPPTPTVSLRT